MPSSSLALASQGPHGTLWVEHPVYTQMVFCPDRVPAVVKEKPELAQVEPFKTVLSGDREAIAKLMSVDEFRAEVKKWLDAARDLTVIEHGIRSRSPCLPGETEEDRAHLLNGCRGSFRAGWRAGGTARLRHRPTRIRAG